MTRLLDEDRLLKQTKLLRQSVQELQEHYEKIQRHMGSAAERETSFKELFTGGLFSGFLERLNGSRMAMLLPAGKDGNFLLLPAGFSSYWHEQHGSLMERMARGDAVLLGGKGAAWYGTSLFHHRPYYYASPRWFSSCGRAYRDITAPEFLVKAVGGDLVKALGDGPADVGALIAEKAERWASQVEAQWDGNRVPENMLQKARDDFELFASLDRESLKRDVERVVGRKTDPAAVLNTIEILLAHYRAAFRFIAAKTAAGLCESAPDGKAVTYWKKVVPQEYGKPPGNWVRWLAGTTAAVAAAAMAKLGPRERDLYRSAAGSLDVRSGPLHWALHLQNLRIMPVAIVNNLVGMAVSRIDYSGLYELEAAVIEHYPGQEGVLEAIHEDILRPLFSTCLQRMLNERQESVAGHTISGQREIIIDDSVRLFSRVTPGVISVRDLFKEYPALLGRSLPMQEVYRRIRKVAPTSEPVLVLGETGTGKELAASAVQRLSRRANESFIVLNSAAIPESLIESELFGHEKGAFTGATARKTGKFEQADGGTLFLDEIGDMSLGTQARILRVIQQQTFERVGGDVTYQVDVRLIAATHKRLEERIAEGTFRDDLFYRLNVYPIVLPPLRERPEDIPLLAVHFILEKQEDMPDLRIREISPAALQLLMNYQWPGNVRQLRNAIGSVLVDLSGERKDRIEKEDLERALRPLESYPRASVSRQPAVKGPGTDRAAIPRWRTEETGAGYRVETGASSGVETGHQAGTAAACVGPADTGQSAAIPLGKVDVDTEVRRWLSRAEAGEQLDDHKLIFRSYGEADGMRIYLALFEAGKQRYGTYKNFVERVGLLSQYSAIRNKLLMFRRKLDEKGESS